MGGRIAWVAGLVLMLSSFMGWYVGASVEGPTLAVIGWHTGTIGKIVFFLGALVVLLAILREAGIELPPSVPESLVTIGVGALATVLVLIRVISIPDTFAGTSGRGIGLWIALLSAVCVIAAGLLQAGEDPVSEPGSELGSSAFVEATSCSASNGLPTKAWAPRSAASLGALLGAAAEHHDRDRTHSVPLLHLAEHLPAVDLRHHHVEQDQVGLLLVDERKPFRGVPGLADGVALRLEADAHVAAHAGVVVDDQHDRAGPPGVTRAGEEVVEIATPEPPVPARRVERREEPLIRPLADRALRDAEVLRSLAERQPVRLGARRPASDIPPRSRHHRNLPKADGS